MSRRATGRDAFVNGGWANLPPKERERLNDPGRGGWRGWLDRLLGGRPDRPGRRGELRRLWGVRRPRS